MTDLQMASSGCNVARKQRASWCALQPAVMQFMAEQQLPKSFLAMAENWFWPLAQQLGTELSSSGHKLRVLGINGAQGTGKSTLAALIRLLLNAGFGLRSAVLSLDDFYLTQHQRQTLAKDLHPLLAVRGVPGTHDVKLALKTINDLLAVDAASAVAVPGFNKAEDDRLPDSAFARVRGPVDLVILEGWCVGVQAQADAELARPVNALEAERDIDGSWRSYVNRQLAGEYQTLFQRMDRLVMLKAPEMEVVEQWRWLQEAKLIAARGGKGEGLMSRQQVAEFIQYYERLTRHCLATLPAQADLVYQLNNDHEITEASSQWLKI